MEHQLIVICNPKRNSFSHAIANRVREASLSKGYEVKIRDLYRMDFDPLLTSKEIKMYDKCVFPEDVEVEHEYIDWADVITFVYPLWWASMPSMLKGYVDRVLCKNFAYERTSKGLRGLLTNKKVFLFTPYGNSYRRYKAIGMFDSMHQTIDEAIIQFCGMKILCHQYYGSIHNKSSEELNEDLRSVTEIVDKYL